MIFYIKGYTALAVSIMICTAAIFLHIPIISQFPLEFGALLFVAILLIWRPLYVNTGFCSDPPNQTMTFSEAMQKHPAAAVASGGAICGFTLVALVSIMVQSLQSLHTQ